MRASASTLVGMLVALLLLVDRPAVAAEIRVLAQCPLDVAISGSITGGDGERFERAVKQARCGLSSVSLNSDGGDMREAMRIGRTLRETRALAAVAVGSRCVSSCVLVFAGGASRGTGGLIGVHRPYFADARALSPAEIAADWRRMASDLRRYLEEMNATPALADLMISTTPEAVKWLTEADLEKYGLLGSDPIEDEISTAEMASYFKLTSAEYRQRQEGALQACLPLLRGRPPANLHRTTDEKSRDPFLICVDAEILLQARAEVARRYERARSRCVEYRDACWQAIVVAGR